MTEWVYVVIAISIDDKYILDSMQVFLHESAAKIYTKNFSKWEMFSKRLHLEK